MALAIVNNGSGYGSGNSVPGSVTLGWTPATGNLLIAVIASNIGDASVTVAAGWTQFEMAQLDDDTQRTLTGMYRYVVGGDTSTLTAFWSGGSTFWGWKVYEISGVSGTFATDYQGSTYQAGSSGATSVDVPAMIARANGCIALTFAAKYNGNVDPTLSSGGYTSDSLSHDSGNYGQFGSAHKALNAGDSSAVTWGIFSGNDPWGGLTIILSPSAATTPTVRRIRQMVATSSTPGSIKMGGAPIAGDLLIAVFGWGNAGNPQPVINTTDWTQFDANSVGGNPTIIGLRKYVSGDARALAALCTSGTAYWSACVIEISGVTGTFGSDFKSDTTNETSSGNLTTGSVTTDKANALAIIVATEYNGSTFISMDSGFDIQAQKPDNGIYGNSVAGVKYIASSGTTFSSTITYDSGNARSYMQMLFEPGSTTETGTGAMAFGGIAMNAAGSDTHAGAGLLSFGGLKMNGAAVDEHAATIGMAFGGLKIVSAGTGVQHPPILNIVVVN